MESINRQNELFWRHFKELDTCLEGEGRYKTASLNVLAKMVAVMLGTDVLSEVSINVVVSPVDMRQC